MYTNSVRSYTEASTFLMWISQEYVTYAAIEKIINNFNGLPNGFFTRCLLLKKSIIIIIIIIIMKYCRTCSIKREQK